MTDSSFQPSAYRNVPLIRLAALDTFSPKGRRLCVRQIGICRADAFTPQGTGSPSRGTVSPRRYVRAGRPGPYGRAYHFCLNGLNSYDRFGQKMQISKHFPLQNGTNVINYC